MKLSNSSIDFFISIFFIIISSTIIITFLLSHYYHTYTHRYHPTSPHTFASHQSFSISSTSSSKIDFYEPEATFSTIARRIIKDLLTYIS